MATPTKDHPTGGAIIDAIEDEAKAIEATIEPGNEIKSDVSEHKQKLTASRAREMLSANPTTISPLLMAKMAERFPVETVLDVMDELRTATYVTKSGEHIDYKAREAFLKLYFGYQVGLPKERVEHVTITMSASDYVNIIQGSPDAQQAVVSLAEMIKRGDLSQLAKFLPKTENGG
jgi:hypothetical protein